MKRSFEEPKVFVECFTVTDQTLTVSWITPDINDDEIDAISPFGGVKAIG